MNLPSTNVSNAQLPASYEGAKKALAECVRIDECRSWADKASAMASYARMSNDETLFKHATRIKARAITRCGELLRAIQPDKGGRPSETCIGSGTSLSRSQAAEDAGLSKRQKDTALRVAAVDPALRDELIESDDPPTITELAELGKKPRPIIDLEGIDPAVFSIATEMGGKLRQFAEACEKYDPLMVSTGFKTHEIEKLRKYVSIIDGWLDSFVVNLGD